MRFLVIIILFFTTMTANCYQIRNMNLQDEIESKNGDTLKLRGAGVRTKLFMDIYIASFYSKTSLSEPKKSLLDSEAKRMQMNFLYDGISADKLRQNWREGIENNNSVEEVSINKHNIDSFLNFFKQTMHKGDEITIDLLPDEGVEMLFNGKLVGSIDDPKFYSLILSVWMGNKPPSKQLQENLFNFRSST